MSAGAPGLCAGLGCPPQQALIRWLPSAPGARGSPQGLPDALSSRCWAPPPHPCSVPSATCDAGVVAATPRSDHADPLGLCFTTGVWKQRATTNFQGQNTLEFQDLNEMSLLWEEDAQNGPPRTCKQAVPHTEPSPLCGPAPRLRAISSPTLNAAEPEPWGCKPARFLHGLASFPHAWQAMGRSGPSAWPGNFLCRFIWETRSVGSLLCGGGLAPGALPVPRLLCQSRFDAAVLTPHDPGAPGVAGSSKSDLLCWSSSAARGCWPGRGLWHCSSYSRCSRIVPNPHAPGGTDLCTRGAGSPTRPGCS